jgi:hypothetical protein
MCSLSSRTMKIQIKSRALLLSFAFVFVVLTFLNSVTKQKDVLNDSTQITNKSMCVITTYFNPLLFKSRQRLQLSFEKHMSSFGVTVITVELAYGNQTFVVTDSSNPNHIQMRTDDVLWYKENLINIGAHRSPPHCQYMAWIDTEIEILNRNWVRDTIAALETFKVVQLYEIVNILSLKRSILVADVSLGWCHSQHAADAAYKKLEIKYRHPIRKFCAPGYAWAMKKDSLVDMGGLFDKDIVGEADDTMARAFTGKIDGKKEIYQKDFVEEMLKWQRPVDALVQSRFGYVEGAINHLWHGSKANKGYYSRRNITNSIEFPYKPQEHVYYDGNGLIHFKPHVKDHYMRLILDYLRSRKEDDTNT